MPHSEKDALGCAASDLSLKADLGADQVRLEDELSQASCRLKLAGAQLDYVRAETAKLEQPGLLQFLGSLLGGSAAKLERIRDAQSELRRDGTDAEQAVRAVEERLRDVENQIGKLSDVEREYAACFDARVQAILRSDDEPAEALRAMSAETDRLATELQNTDAAVEAAGAALRRVENLNSTMRRVRKRGMVGHSVVASTAWRATKRQFAKPFVTRLREGLERLDERISALDLGMDGEESTALSTIAAQTASHTLSLDGGWTVGAMGDYGAANEIEDDLRTLMRGLNERRERLDRGLGELEARRRALVVQT